MIKHIYLLPAEAYVAHLTDAQVIGVSLGEMGFNPIYTRAKPDDLNHEPLSTVVKQSAVAASMFGWHIPAALPAKEYLDRVNLTRELP